MVRDNLVEYNKRLTYKTGCCRLRKVREWKYQHTPSLAMTLYHYNHIILLKCHDILLNNQGVNNQSIWCYIALLAEIFQ